MSKLTTGNVSEAKTVGGGGEEEGRASLQFRGFGSTVNLPQLSRLRARKVRTYSKQHHHKLHFDALGKNRRS